MTKHLLQRPDSKIESEVTKRIVLVLIAEGGQPIDRRTDGRNIHRQQDERLGFRDAVGVGIAGAHEMTVAACPLARHVLIGHGAKAFPLFDEVNSCLVNLHIVR